MTIQELRKHVKYLKEHEIEDKFIEIPHTGWVTLNLMADVLTKQMDDKIKAEETR